MRNWDELTEIEQLAQIYSDQYKDAYGFRPRGESGHPQTVEEYNKELDRLGEIIHEQITEEKIRERTAFGEWKVNIRKIMDICSCSKVEAIKHDIEANGAMYFFDQPDGQEAWSDVEEYIWKIGIGFDKQKEIEGLFNGV